MLKSFRACRSAGSRSFANRCAGVAITLSVLGGLAASSPRGAFADSLPAQTAPAGFRSVDNGSGGRILDGALPGATSMSDAFHASLRRLGGYFAPGSLDIGGAVRSPDDALTTAFFRAKLRGVPVAGMAVVAAGPQGGYREAVLFDTAARFAKSLPVLTARLRDLPADAAPAKGGAGHSAAHTVAAPVPRLYPHESPDRTVGVSIPTGWQVANIGSGRVAVRGPKKESVVLNFTMSFLAADSQRAKSAEQMAQMTHTRAVTPMPIAPYTGDAAQDYAQANRIFSLAHGLPDPQVYVEESKASEDGSTALAGTLSDRGEERKFLATAIAAPGALGSWSMTVWQISAPASEFARALPTLLAIERSCTYNGQADRRVKAGETQQVLKMSKDAMNIAQESHDADMTASQSRFSSWKATTQAQRDGMDRATAAWVHYLSDTAVVNETATGSHGTVSSGVAGFLTEHFPGDFQTVSQSEYHKGVDY